MQNRCGQWGEKRIKWPGKSACVHVIQNEGGHSGLEIVLVGLVRRTQKLMRKANGQAKGFEDKIIWPSQWVAER